MQKAVSDRTRLQEQQRRYREDHKIKTKLHDSGFKQSKELKKIEEGIAKAQAKINELQPKLEQSRQIEQDKRQKVTKQLQQEYAPQVQQAKELRKQAERMQEQQRQQSPQRSRI